MNEIKTEKSKSFLSIIMGIYVLLIGMGLPIIIRDSYFDILFVKYYFYWICTVLMLVSCIIYFIAADNVGLLAEGIKKKLTVQDYAVFLFLLVAIISTLSSDYLYEAFWGNEGRFTGLFLLSLYVLSYLFVSRFWTCRNFYIDGILIVGMFVSLFGITDYFQMDIFRFRVGVVVEQKSIFTSTIGNINTYTSYVGMIAAISTVLFATAKKTKRMVLYYICMVISFFAMVMGVSDNAYLSLIVLFGFLPLYLFSEKRGIKRYLIILSTFFSVIQITAWINIWFKDVVIGIDSAFNIITNAGVLLYLIVVFWGLISLWCIVDYKKGLESKEYGKRFQYIWLVIILLVVVVVVYALYDCNVSGNVQRYGSFGTYLVFNDEWGTHRGYIWRNSIEEFVGFSLWKKLVGFGPETFGILMLQKTSANSYNEIFDAAHNEYLQLLLTVGIIGVTSYVIFILAYIKRCFGCRNKNSYMIAMVFGVICYSAQAFVNLNVPVVTPVFWLLLSMGSAMSMENDKVK